MKTIFCDIDGTILKHQGTLQEMGLAPAELLPGVAEKFNQWKAKAYTIILTTGRPESMRDVTQAQLESFGIFYDMMIMGLSNGARVLINDVKPHGPQAGLPMAESFNVRRDRGLQDVNV